MAIQSNFPAIKPSLLLDFANTKQLDPRITFTRASTATFYNGVTTAMAEQNLFLQSQTFTTTWLFGRSTITGNTVVAPDGTTTGSTLTSTDNTPLTYQAKPTSSSGTLSCYIKKGTSDFAFIYVDNPSLVGNVGYFNINTGVVGSFGGAITGVSIVSVGNGWYRCIANFSGVSGTNVGIGLCDADNNTNCTVGRTIFLWGAQLEQRSAVTAYTATTTQAITNYIPVLQTAASGVARFDNNPTTGESLGLLIEESRTNLVLRSDDYANASWTKTNASIDSNTIVAPDGTLTGDKLVEDTATGNHAVQQGGITISASTTYTVTTYAKAAGRDWLFILDNNNPSAVQAYFNVSTGALGTVGGSATATITSVGNSWYRCSVTFATGPSQSSINLIIRTASANGTNSYTGNGFSGLFLWGTQVELGAFATSYIPTVASQVTRAADAASMTGTNFSTWYNQGEGTLYTETRALSDTIGDVSNGLSIGLTAGSASSMALLMDTRTPQSGTFALLNNSVSTGSVSVNTTMLGGSRRMGAAYATNNVIMAVGGVLSTADTSTVIPTGTQLSIGLYPFNTSLFDSGYVQKIAYYPIRVTNTQLQALTS